MHPPTSPRRRRFFVYAVLAMSSSACSTEPTSVDRASADAHELPATLSLAASDFWIEITPDSATVAPGGTVQLSVIGRSRDGLRWTVRTTWQAPAGGAVSASGQYVAPQTPGRYPVVATREGDVQTDTAFVRVSLPSAPLALPTSGGCNNEPTGYRRVATANWNQLPGRQPEVSSDYMTYFHDQIPTLSIVQDAAAPASPSSVLRVLYPAGFRGGESPSR